MAIKLRATNIKTYVKNTCTTISRSYAESSEKVLITATNGDLEISSAKRVVFQGLDGGVQLGRKVEFDPIVVPEEKKQWKIKTPLVIDRYKMPGLNGTGTDIADDMTYGIGDLALAHTGGQQIIDKSTVEAYKKAYESNAQANTNGNINDDFSGTQIYDPKERIVKYKENQILQSLYKAMIGDVRGEKIGYNNLRDDKARYTFQQIFSTKYGKTNTGEGTHEMYKKKKVAELWEIFENRAKGLLSAGALEGNISRMIAKFKSNTGGIYSDAALTQAVAAHESTKTYCSEVIDYIKQKIKTCNYDLTKIEDKKVYFDSDNYTVQRKDAKKESFRKPSFTYKEDINTVTVPAGMTVPVPVTMTTGLKGLTIALNDIWSAEVVLTKFNTNGNNYSGEIQVTLWDHFGLDLPDMQKKFNTIPLLKDTFSSWFILQHIYGYKPFITKIEITNQDYLKFKGSI